MSRVSRGLWVCALWGCSEGAPVTTATDVGTTDVASADVVSADAGGAALDDAGDGGSGDGGPDTRAQTLTHRMGPWMVAAGAERSSECESWTLNNDEPLYLSTVEMNATAGMHHSNWFFVPDTHYVGPDGTWACRTRNFDQGVASYLGGVFFAQSTQVQRETQQFPPGTAVVIPPHSRIIGALHMLNASPAARQVGIDFTVRTLARSAVRTRLSPFYLEYGPLEITPRGRSQFDVECALDERSRSLTGSPLDLRFFYGLAHYHELGSQMRVTVLGGPMDGRALYETDARQGESWARTMEPAVDVSGARALRLTCVFDNTRSATVRYGIGDQEMCIWFGFTDSAYQWAGRATQAARPMVQTSVRDGVTHNLAPCNELITLRSRSMGD
jgi:hypothetical protein